MSITSPGQGYGYLIPPESSGGGTPTSSDGSITVTSPGGVTNLVVASSIQAGSTLGASAVQSITAGGGYVSITNTGTAYTVALSVNAQTALQDAIDAWQVTDGAGNYSGLVTISTTAPVSPGSLDAWIPPVDMKEWQPFVGGGTYYSGMVFTQNGLGYQNQTGGTLVTASTFGATNVSGNPSGFTLIPVPVPSITLPGEDTALPSLGVTNTVADGGHTHGRSEWNEHDRGLIAETYLPDTIQAGTILPASGTIQAVRLHIPFGVTVSNAILLVSVATSGVTTGTSYCALYDAATNTLRAVTADVGIAGTTVNWLSNGQKIMPFTTPYVITQASAGDYYLAFWCTATTLPTFGRASNGFATANLGLATASGKYVTANTGATTAPGTLGTFTLANTAWYAAVS